MENYSVLMSIYDKVNPNELDLSINSMVNQSIPPEQFVVVYDGPLTKSLCEVVQKYESKMPGLFTIVKLKKNMGLAYALNAGIDACRNQLIARMDCDDYSVQHRCEIQINEFKNDNTLVLLGGCTQHFIDSPDVPLQEYYRPPLTIEEIKRCIKRNSAFSHPTVMFKKDAVIKSGYYDVTLRRSQDHDLFSRMIWLGFNCKNIGETLLLFKIDKNCVLRNKNSDSLNARLLIQKRLYERGQCTIIDYCIINIMVYGAKKLPNTIFVKLYNIFKR